ncbi:hypothetical protein ACFWMR_18900 [Amycolatopsis thailandensis]|uniref:hypothetical protein n=1 Tax=Amycolatopsis thailandensis TaxID=589330 RepID=UPI00365C946E
MPDQPPVYTPGFTPGSICKAPPAGGSYGTPVADGAGFKYDEATLHELADEWIDLAKEYRADLVDAEFIAKVEPPGQEFASGDNALVTRRSGQALVDALNQRITYCNNMAAKYVAALGKYASADEQAKTVINQQPKGIA